MELTSTHEDYIEAVFRRSSRTGKGVRITDLAEDLGCRLPTVTRTVRVLARRGIFAHAPRGLVRLTRKGRAMAREIAHRHDDVIAFLSLVLALPPRVAEADACQIEHGLSPRAAARLHAFLEYFEELPAQTRKRIRAEVVRRAKGRRPFGNLVEVRAGGWRG